MAILNNLIVHGRSRFLNGINANTINAKSIGANKGVFNELIATTLNVETATIDDLTAQNATVVGLLDVRGELKTNTWSNSNIATIEGNFFIAPTLASGTGETLVSGLTISFASNNWTITITGTFDLNQIGADPVDSSDTATNQWSVGSKVLITGEIGKTDGIYPLGTLMGEIQSASPSSFTITKVTDNLGKTDILSTLGTGTYQYRNVKISLTQRKYGSSSTASDNMRPIGILMSAQGRSSKSFIDIYGGANNLRSGAISGATTDFGGLAIPNVRIGNLRGLPNVISGDFTQNEALPTGWGIYTDNGYFKGTIVSESGKIGNFTLGTAIYGAASGAGPSSISATTAGTYLGTDGFRSNKSGDTTKYVQITDGIITAKGADITGAVNATSFIAYDNANNTNRIRATVSADGLIVYDGNGVASSNIQAQFGDTATIGKTSGDNYNINITGTAIDLRYNTSILNRINNAGMTIYNTNKYQIAKFGQETVLGTIIPNNFYTKVNSSGITIYHTVDDNAAPVWNSSNSCYEYPDLISVSYAQFGNTSRIGYEDRAHITIDSTSYKQYGVDGNNDLFISLEDLRDPDFLVANIVETFTDRSSSFLDLLFEISTVSSSGMLTTYHLPQVTKNGVTLTYDTDFSISSDSKRRLIFTDLISSADIIEVNYFTKDKMAKSFTLGKRNETAISGPYSFVIGYNNKATGFLSYAEGSSTTASGESSHAEGYNATASGSVSHAEGFYTTASGSYSHAEGHNATASGSVSHAEGYYSTASGTYSHAEGLYAVASNAHSHAEGHHARASGSASHAEGYYSTASGSYSHAEGFYTTASRPFSHAEGNYTTAQGTYSHVQNLFTVATENSQTVIGKYNSAIRSGSGTTADPYTYSDAGDYAFIIGNGTDDATAARSNALTVDWNGNTEQQGRATTEDMTSTEIDNFIESMGVEPVSFSVETYEISSFNSGWAIYSDVWKVILKRCGRIVELNGALRNTSAVTVGSGGLDVFSLPSSWSSYFPQYDVHTICQSSNAMRFLLTVYPDGRVTFARNGYVTNTSGTSSYVSSAAGSWFPFHVTWIA